MHKERSERCTTMPSLRMLRSWLSRMAALSNMLMVSRAASLRFGAAQRVLSSSAPLKGPRARKARMN
eukprot:7473005-Alexandrium_andersonii.AAC.1